MIDPNTEFENFKRLSLPISICIFLKINKYRHKLTECITSGIIKSIEFREKLYNLLKTCAHKNPEYEHLKHNLKVYNVYQQSMYMNS